MNSLLAAIATGTAIAGLVMTLGIFFRRSMLGRYTRHDDEISLRLRPLAISIAAGMDAEVPTLTPEETHIFAGILTGMATSVRGDARERFGRWAEDLGLVEVELAILLESRHAWKRAAAAHLLGRLCSHTAVVGLKTALHDRHRDVREVAALALGHLGAPDSAPWIISAFADGSLPRATAVQATLMLGASATPALREGTSSETPSVQRLCIEVLGFVGDAADGVTVIPRLRDASDEVRAAAARSLGRLGSGAAVGPLVTALRDPADFVRSAAAEALGRLGALDARDVLVRAANEDTSWWVAKNASRALAKIDPRLVVRASAEPGASAHLIEAADVIAL